MKTIQVAIIKRNGKNKGLYRVEMVNGEWESYWHGMEVKEAQKALKNGRIDMSGMLGECRVKSYAG